MKEIKEKIEQNKAELDRAPLSGGFARAGEIQYSILPKLQKELALAQERNKNNTLIREEVTDYEIASIVCK